MPSFPFVRAVHLTGKVPPKQGLCHPPGRLSIVPSVTIPQRSRGEARWNTSSRPAARPDNASPTAPATPSMSPANDDPMTHAELQQGAHSRPRKLMLYWSSHNKAIDRTPDLYVARRHPLCRGSSRGWPSHATAYAGVVLLPIVERGATCAPPGLPHQHLWYSGRGDGYGDKLEYPRGETLFLICSSASLARAHTTLLLGQLMWHS